MARTRRVWGEIRIQAPSRFLDDLPPSSLAQPRRTRAPVPSAPRIVDGDWAGRARPSGRPAASRARDEFDQRTAHDDEPVFRVDDGDFAVGQHVAHDTLGAGRVVAVTGTGKDRRVVVEFDAVGRKTVLAKFLAHGGPADGPATGGGYN